MDMAALRDLQWLSSTESDLRFSMIMRTVQI